MIDDHGLYQMRPVEAVCADVNRVILEDMTTELYCTMIIADCDLGTGEVRVCQAGHPSLLQQDAAGETAFVGDGGLPVGLIPGARYEVQELTLAPGDRLLMYSDGITECADPEGTLLDQSGLERMIKRNADRTGPDLLDALLWDLADYAQQKEPADDISAVLFEFKGPASQG